MSNGWPSVYLYGKSSKTALYSPDFSIVCHKTDKGVVLWHTL
jgi:hypothetical protein